MTYYAMDERLPAPVDDAAAYSFRSPKNLPQMTAYDFQPTATEVARTDLYVVPVAEKDLFCQC